MELWAGIGIILCIDAVLYFIIRGIARLSITASMVATVLAAGALSVIYYLLGGSLSVDAIFAILALCGISFGVVQIGKALWGAGLIQKAAGVTFVSLASGSALYVLTGDPSFGTNGAVIISAVSGLSFFIEA